MATVLLSPVQAAFVLWNRTRPIKRIGDFPPSPQEIFEAGFRAGLLEQQPKPRKRNKGVKAE